MTQTLTKHERYVADFQAFKNTPAVNGAAWLQPVRERALARFIEMGFPTARRGNEKWKYTSVSPIAQATFSYPMEERAGMGVTGAAVRAAAPWHHDWVNLVFVNGHYSEALSTAPARANGIRATSLAEAVVSNRQLVEQHLACYASVEDDAFTALNTAFVQDGAFVHIPEGASLESPLHLLFISTEREEPTVSHPRVLVVAGAGSRATIIETYLGLSSTRYFTNAVAEMVVGEGANVDHYRVLAESENAFHVGVARVRLGENCTFSSHTFEKGAALGRYDLYVLLDGQGSSCFLNGLYMTSGAQHMDNFVNIDHTQPHTTSRLNYKGILDGKSRAIFGGTVFVRKGAQKTDAKQSDKNLVLSPDAEVDSKPALYIYADDVKCGHGATAGNIDRDTVFYLRSRGLDLEAASHLLIYGFASEIIETVQVPQLKAYLEKLFLESLPSYRFEF